MPDPAKTPGDVLTTDTDAICQKGYTKTVRDVPEPLKNQVYRSYGIADRQAGEYEIDHLVSLELGGSNSARQPLAAVLRDETAERPRQGHAGKPDAQARLRREA